MIDAASACACSWDTPGFSRTIDCIQPLPRCCRRSPPIISRCIVIGTHAADDTPRNEPRKPSGATPTMVIGVLLIVTCLPTTAGSPLKRRCQYGVADHHNWMAAGGHIILSSEQTARRRTQPHDLEIVAADERTPGALGGFIHRNAESLIVLCHHVHERGAIAEILVIGIRPRAAMPFAVLHGRNADGPRICRHRDGTEQHRLHPHKNRGIRSNPEAEREDGGDGQPGILQQRAD